RRATRTNAASQTGFISTSLYLACAFAGRLSMGGAIGTIGAVADGEGGRIRKIDFIFVDAGGGHRAAANALRQVMEQQGRACEIRMVNLQELLDSLDVFRKITGLRLQELYNLMLKKGWTLGSAQLMAAMQLIIRMFHAKEVRMLEQFWGESRPDLVVS